MPIPGWIPSAPSLRPASLLALLAVATPAIANMAEPPQPRSVRAGSAAGEITGGLSGIRVLRERLLIDLRPVADAKPAVVEATYRLRNEAAAREVTLWFVADALTSG